jgi:hypothetical protein
MPGARVSALPTLRVAIDPKRLESCIRRLDPADRALLDLSLNRGIPDSAMAPVLRCDPMRLAWKRARALERVASRVGVTDPPGLAAVRMALTDLPSRAWLPLELQPAPAPPVLAPPEPEAPIVVRPAQALAPRPTTPVASKGMPVRRPIGRAASSFIGGLSERAKRAYPRETMTTRARRAAGALAIGAAAALTLRRR